MLKPFIYDNNLDKELSREFKSRADLTNSAVKLNKIVAKCYNTDLTKLIHFDTSLNLVYLGKKYAEISVKYLSEVLCVKLLIELNNIITDTNIHLTVYNTRFYVECLNLCKISKTLSKLKLEFDTSIKPNEVWYDTESSSIIINGKTLSSILDPSFEMSFINPKLDGMLLRLCRYNKVLSNSKVIKILNNLAPDNKCNSRLLLTSNIEGINSSIKYRNKTYLIRNRGERTQFTVLGSDEVIVDEKLINTLITKINIVKI